MSAEFEITTTDLTVLKLEPGDTGTFSFLVRGLTGPGKDHEVALQARTVRPDGKDEQVDWLVPGPQSVIAVAGDGTANVTITARPIKSTPGGSYKIKLVVANNAPPQQRVDSPTVTCKVFGPPPPPPRPRWLRWWVVALALTGTFIAGIWMGGSPQSGIVGLPILGALAGLGFLVWRLVARLVKH